MMNVNFIFSIILQNQFTPPRIFNPVAALSFQLQQTGGLPSLAGITGLSINPTNGQAFIDPVAANTAALLSPLLGSTQAFQLNTGANYLTQNPNGPSFAMLANPAFSNTSIAMANQNHNLPVTAIHSSAQIPNLSDSCVNVSLYQNACLGGQFVNTSGSFVVSCYFHSSLFQSMRTSFLSLLAFGIEV